MFVMFWRIHFLSVLRVCPAWSTIDSLKQSRKLNIFVSVSAHMRCKLLNIIKLSVLHRCFSMKVTTFFSSTSVKWKCAYAGSSYVLHAAKMPAMKHYADSDSISISNLRILAHFSEEYFCWNLTSCFTSSVNHFSNMKLMEIVLTYSFVMSYN